MFIQYYKLVEYIRDQANYTIKTCGVHSLSIRAS